MKAQIIDGKVFRVRRNKLVQVPDAWVGKITTNETIRQRPSKLLRKVRRTISGHGKLGLDWVDGRYNQIDEDA